MIKMPLVYLLIDCRIQASGESEPTSSKAEVSINPRDQVFQTLHERHNAFSFIIILCTLEYNNFSYTCVLSFTVLYYTCSFFQSNVFLYMFR